MNNNAEIREKIESVIDLIEQTQQEDGYLDTYYICENRIKAKKYCTWTMKCIVQDIYWKQRLDMRRVTGEERFLAYYGAIYKMVYGSNRTK